MAGHKVTERIVRQIRERISRGEFKPHDRLPSERHLADSLHASRASVREALRALEHAGILQSRHGEGTFLRAAPDEVPTPPLAQFLERERERLLDLSEARQLLEPRLASHAAERATAADLERLHEALAAERRHVGGADIETVFNADRAFHMAIAEATHSPTFIMLHNYLSDLVAGLRREAIYHDSQRTPTRHLDHAAIVEAIAARDGGRARDAMLRHLKNVESVLNEALWSYQHAVAGLGAPRAARKRGA